MDIEKIIAGMTLEDKTALCSGADFWQTKGFEKYGIPSFFMSDGPHGLRKQDVGKGTDMLGVNESAPATCFPSEVTTAGSWDTDLLSEIGAAIGEEARAQQVGLVLGPGANIKRNPLCGRNFEYFSEDPFLSGKLAAGLIRGIEAQGVGSCLKHFACNSQELDRFTSDSVIDERTLREIYLTGFEIAVKEGHPSAVMCAYPKLNGVHCSDNKELLTDVLRREWGFDGMVVTDWGAMNDRIAGFRAGCDLSMPGGSNFMEKECAEAVKNGTLAESDIDASVRRLLNLTFRAAELKGSDAGMKTEEHHALAVKAAEKSAVLLKNDGGILPLSPTDEKLALVGAMAKNMRIQGAGSSHINATKTENPVDFFTDAAYAAGCREDGSTDEKLLAEVRTAAASADKVVVFAGLPGSCESEGFDRDDLRMPEGQIKMIEAAAEANPNTVVVLICGSVVECPWTDRVKAILYMGLPGQGGARAVFDLLAGKANPSGRLAETWPLTYADVPSSEIYDKTKDGLYMEGIYVGYRYYDRAGVPVRWPFGFGLSYTRFAYSGLRVNGNTVSVSVSNTGDRSGEETVQLYILKNSRDGVHRPERELKAFAKVSLEAGETKTVELTLPERAFSVWNNGWVTEAGEYTLSVGAEKCTVSVDGTAPVKEESGSWYETLKGKPSQADWEKALGRKYVAPVLRKGSFTMDNTVEEMKDYSLIMKIMYSSTESVIAKQFGGKKDYSDPNFRMLMKSSAGGPLRSMQISGGIKGGLFEGMLDMANGHFFRGIGKMLKK